MTAPDADLTFHYVHILHPFNYKSMRLEQRLKVEFREFDGFLRHQLERVQQDPYVSDMCVSV